MPNVPGQTLSLSHTHTHPHIRTNKCTHASTHLISLLPRTQNFAVTWQADGGETEGLFCRILSLLKGSFAKKTYNFEEPTNRSHPIQERRGRDMGWLRLVGSSKL